MESWSSANRGCPRNYRDGLLCHYLFRDGSAQYIFLDLADEGSVVVNRSLSFNTESNMHICASSNGLLLLSSVNGNLLRYNLFNLLTEQCVVLPQPQITRRSIGTGLAFDGFHYQVVRIFSSEGDRSIKEPSSSSAPSAARGGRFIEMEIFSSETGIWKRHCPPIHLPSDLPKLSTIPLFSNGAIHWELGGYLLMYYVNSSYCRLIELPNYPQKWSCNSLTFGQCLWEAQGYVHYCYTDSEGIHTWVLLKEEDHQYYSSYYHYDRDRYQWKLAHTVTHQYLMCQNPEIFLRMGRRNIYFIQWEPYFISPFAYIQSFQTLYLRLPGMIVSYNLRTQALKEVCSYEFPDSNFHCCLLVAVVHSSKDGARGGHAKPAFFLFTQIRLVTDSPVLPQSSPLTFITSASLESFLGRRV